jgi:hypothetical protein
MTKSKVQPRKIPDVKISAKEKGKVVVNNVEYYAPTPIPVLQAIGVNLCGMHPSDLSSQKLLAENVEEDDASQ